MPLSQIFQSPTIEKLAIAIEEMARYRAEYEDKQYLLFNGERDRKIFCFPPLLGYGFAYKRMASGIPSHSVYAFDFLDSESRVQTYVRWIQELQPAGAIRLLGYSAGGNLAFEAAKELEKSGRAVSDIILLDAIRIKNKRGISELEIKTTIRDNLNYFADYMMKDGDLKMFVANDYVREQMAVRMRAYLRYLNESPNAGAIHANIHLIKSSDQSHTTDCETGWPEVTLSRFLSYQGFGRHGDMVDDAFVEKNAALIEAIINR